MGVMNAMLTAVTGLSAQSYALENISGNIANSQTVGFKRVDTSFVDMIPEAPARREVAGSVAAFSKLTNTLGGSTQNTGISTNMALNGNGWFTVQKNTGSIATPTFSGQDTYTRRGDFSPDASGYLVNGSGNYLIGTMPGRGQVPIQIDTSPVPAQATTTLSYQANLPSLPKTSAYDPAVPNSELAPIATGATISGTNRAAFESQSIPGGELTVYDAGGTASVLQTRWAKTANAGGDGTGTPAANTPNTWKLYYVSNDAATAGAPVYSQVGSDVTFTTAGVMTSAATAAISPLTINGRTIGDVTVTYPAGKVTQYGDASGQISNGDIDQNGYPSGSLTGVTITSDGALTGSYSNGEVRTIATVQVAHFKADNELKRLDGGTYAQTLASGTPSFGMQGSSILSGSVEMSNTDIAEEFSKMIVTQQAYSANTRVITTAQSMLEEVINIIR